MTALCKSVIDIDIVLSECHIVLRRCQKPPQIGSVNLKLHVGVTGFVVNAFTLSTLLLACT